MNTIDFSALTSHPAVSTIARAFSEAGAEIALVGGVVRDALNGDLSDDLDFTTNLRPDQFRSILKPLGKVWETGAEYGTLAVNLHGEKVEITTYRSEVYEENSRKPIVGFGDSLLEDLSRRDLTINAMALCLSVVKGEVSASLVDHFGGAADLENGVLRSPSDPLRTMSEDPLRILRAVRFAALRKMKLDDSLRDAVKSTKDRIKIVAQERKLSELEKMLKSSSVTARSLALSMELGVAEEIFGSLVSNRGLETLALLEGGRRETLLLLALAAEVNEFALRDLRFSKADVRALAKDLQVTRLLMSELSTRDMRKLVFDSKGESLESSFQVLQALGLDTQLNEKLFSHLAETEEDLLKALAVDGNDALERGFLGLDVGRALEAVKEELFRTGQMSHARALEVFDTLA